MFSTLSLKYDVVNGLFFYVKKLLFLSSISVGILKLALELPFFSKYLLIAAYLASNNPSRTDRRFFCKKSCGKMSKRAKTSIKHYASGNKFTG